MPRWHPSRCRVCGVYTTPDAPISAQGFCHEHGKQRELANIEQMANGAGPFYEHWLYRWTLAANRRLVALQQQKG